MALVGEIAQAVFRTALAVIENREGDIAEGALARRLIELHGQASGQTFAAYQAIARMARRAITAADAVTAAGGGVVGADDLPRVPWLTETAEGYSYRVVIDVTDPNTLTVYSYQVEIVSDHPMSLQELAQQGQDNFSHWTTPRVERQGIGNVSENAHVQVTVLSAGRR